MQLKLERYSYSSTETEGELFIKAGNRTFNFATIERPWIPDPDGNRGGKRSESCVPDGAYVLSPWVRPNGDEVYILYSPELGVWRLPGDDGYAGGRTLILMHTGNWVTDVIGCIAPGMARRPMTHPKTGEITQAVTLSRVAMNQIKQLLGRDRAHTLLITNECGASDVRI